VAPSQVPARPRSPHGAERHAGSPAAPVFRFAPSPNGYLHRGHAFSALYNHRAALAAGGRFLLRIEDIDLARARPAFYAAIEEDLAWLGLAWERPVLRQSGRFEAYRAALRELDRLGLLYPAFMSRAEIAAAVGAAPDGGAWPRDPDGAPHYPGPERAWSARRRRAEIDRGAPYALRLDMAAALGGMPPLSWCERDPLGGAPAIVRPAEAAAWGDVVLARKEVPASYHLAVVVDDAHQGVSHVVRGADLLAATSVHVLLQALLGLTVPTWFHHRLVLDEGGRKLAKSRGSETIRGRRAAGESAAELIVGLPAPIGFAPVVADAGRH
jgi:glutamyl-Q tRNA(Asp) synthetase